MANPSVHKGHRERLKSRFLESGLDSFTDVQALELLLFYAIPQKDTNPIAHALMDRYGSLSAVLNAPVEDLQKVEGIGKSAAILIHTVAQINQKAAIDDAASEHVLNSSERAGKYLLTRYSGKKRELVYQLCLDQKGKLLACKLLGEGGVTAAAVDVRQVVENAILTSASAVILAHNHPSGIALPSREDYDVTDRAKAALATIGVTLMDHIIVADGDFVSMAENGIIQRRSM